MKILKLIFRAIIFLHLVKNYNLFLRTPKLFVYPLIQPAVDQLLIIHLLYSSTIAELKAVY